MSKQSGDSALQGSSTRPGSSAGRPSTSLANFPQHGQHGAPTNSPGAQRSQPGPSQPQTGIQLPPLPQSTNVTSGSFPRSVGLPSILNPSTEDDQPRGLRRKADQIDSPPSSVTSLPPLMTGSQPGGPVSHGDTQSKPFGSAPQPPQNRPTLTPRSPTFQRPTTYQSFHPPTGTISAIRSPFPTSPRTGSYGTEHNTQSFPTPPVANRPSYEYPAPPRDLNAASRRTSAGASRLTRAPSSSASPSTTYSSFSQAGALDERQRARNAGASARFRQRRKEKERESSTTISKLEQRLKAAADDADFYKRERDYLAGVLLQVPGGDRHFPRPQSPRHRRSSTITSAMSASGSAGYLSGSEQYAPRSPDQGRNVRRRTSVHSLPPPPLPPAPMAVQGSTPGLSGQAYARPPLAPQPSPYHQGSAMPSPLGGGGMPGAPQLPPPHHMGSSNLMQAPPPTGGPWNPYAATRHPQPPRTQS